MTTGNYDRRSGAPAYAGAVGRSSTTIPVLPLEVADAVGDARNHLAQYILVRELGQGGSGTVYAAWDRKLGRWAAVKILNQINEENAARFLREAQMASRLSHPSIVPLFEASEADDGRPFLAMKLVSGRQLSKVQLEIKTACSVMRDVADAVQYAHDNGVIHRDLKPQNLMLDDAGHVWILDFGIAHSVGTGSTLTAAGAILGTPAFMPPEQARGAHCDERSDVYALGATLYALLSGRPPFEGDSALWVMSQVLADDPPALRLLNNRVARDVENIVHKAMRREPAQRYLRARAFADDLRRYERGDVVMARPLPLLARAGKKVKRNPVAAVVVVALVLGVGLFGWGSLRFASDMRVREQATAEARALAEARLAQTKKILRVAEINRAEGIVEEGNALGASGQWQAAASRYQAADTMFKGLEIDDPGPNAGITDVLMNAPPPVWSEPAFHAERITELLVNSEETAAYSSSLDGTVKVFDPRTRQVKHVFDVGDPVWSLAVNASATRLAAGANDGRVVVWDLRDYSEVTTFRSTTARVRSLAFSPDGRRLTGGHSQGEVVTWDLDSSKLVQRWREASAQVRSVAYAPHGGTIVAGLAHSRVGPWATLRAASSGRALRTFEAIRLPSGIWNLAIDRLTGRLLAGFAGGFISVGGQGQAAQIYTQSGATPHVALSSSEGLIVLAFPNAAMQVRDYNDPLRVLFSVKQEAGQVAVPGRHGRVWSADATGGIKLWSVGPQPAMGRVANRTFAIGIQMVMAGEVIVVEEVDGGFVAVDRGTGKSLWTVKLPVPKGSYSAPSARADLLATSDQKGLLRVFELPSGRQRFSIMNDTPPRFLRFSGKGDWLAGTFNTEGRLWNAKTGSVVAVFKAPDSHRLIAWAPDDRHFVMAQDKDLTEIDTQTLKVTRSFPYHKGWVASDGFIDSKNQSLVVAFKDRGVLSYDLKDGRESSLVVSNHVNNQVARASGAGVLWFGEGNPEGQVGVTLWDLAKDRRLHVFDSGRTKVAEPHLPQDVPLAASVTGAGDVVVWDLSLPSRFYKAADDFETASKRADGTPANHLSMARYYTLRGLHDWAAEQFDLFYETGGGLRAEVSALEYGRALWLGGRLDAALVQYRRAFANGEAATDYLNLCIAAIKRARK